MSGSPRRFSNRGTLGAVSPPLEPSSHSTASVAWSGERRGSARFLRIVATCLVAEFAGARAELAGLLGISGQGWRSPLVHPGQSEAAEWHVVVAGAPQQIGHVPLGGLHSALDAVRQEKTRTATAQVARLLEPRGVPSRSGVPPNFPDATAMLSHAFREPRSQPFIMNVCASSDLWAHRFHARSNLRERRKNPSRSHSSGSGGARPPRRWFRPPSNSCSPGCRKRADRRPDIPGGNHRAWGNTCARRRVCTTSRRPAALPEQGDERWSAFARKYHDACASAAARQ